MKYSHRGYKDDEREDERGDRSGSSEPRPPRRDPDMPGGRLSEPQRKIRNLRCHHCGHALPLEQDVRGDIVTLLRDAKCDKCAAAVHACRNCIHFDPLSHMECRKPVKVRYRKNDANDCDLFEPKVVVEMTRDSSRSEGSFAPTATSAASPRTQTDARKAFDDLFKTAK